jgi:hypothetical protein
MKIRAPLRRESTARLARPALQFDDYHVGEQYQSDEPSVLVIVVEPEQRLEDIATLVLDFDTALPPRFMPSGSSRWIKPIILTGDRQGFEAARR